VDLIEKKELLKREGNSLVFTTSDGEDYQEVPQSMGKE
jgi:hypothetical protein